MLPPRLIKETLVAVLGLYGRSPWAGSNREQPITKRNSRRVEKLLIMRGRLVGRFNGFVGRMFEGMVGGFIFDFITSNFLPSTLLRNAELVG